MGTLYLYSLEINNTVCLLLQKTVNLRHLQESSQKSSSITNDYVHCLVSLSKRQVGAGLADGSVFLVDYDNSSNNRIYKVSSQFIIHVQQIQLSGKEYLAICDGMGRLFLIHRGQVQTLETRESIQKILIQGEWVFCCTQYREVHVF